MKKHTFIVGTLILTIGGFIAKIIGAFYKIPLTNILGSSGMGIYYLVFPLYNLLLVISSGGVGIAVTKLVAQSRVNRLKKNERMYFKAGLTISFVLSMLFSIFVFAFANKLAYRQGNGLSYFGFIAISPAIVAASLVAIIKAFFQGRENMLPSSIAMISEQFVKMIVGLLLSIKLLRYGIEYAVMGAVIAVTISEIFTLLIMLLNLSFYRKQKNSTSGIVTSKFKLGKINPYRCCKALKNRQNFYYLNSGQKIVTFKRAVKDTLSIFLPNTLMLIITPLVTLIDSFMVINLLIKSGYSASVATGLYGINNGVVSSLIALPVIITSSIATSVVPNLSGLSHSKNAYKVSERTAFFIKITWIIVLPIFIYFFVMADKIIMALYNFSTNNVINEYGFACKLLMLSSISIIYNAMLSTLVSVLQSINKAHKVFFVLFFGMIIRTVVSIVLIQSSSINIFGTIIANIVFLSFGVCGCTLILKRSIDLNINLIKFFIIPLIVAIMCGVIVYYIAGALQGANVWLSLIICGIILLGVYVLLITLLKCFDESELKYIPFLKRK